MEYFELPLCHESSNIHAYNRHLGSLEQHKLVVLKVITLINWLKCNWSIKQSKAAGLRGLMIILLNAKSHISTETKHPEKVD